MSKIQSYQYASCHIPILRDADGIELEHIKFIKPNEIDYSVRERTLNVMEQYLCEYYNFHDDIKDLYVLCAALPTKNRRTVHELVETMRDPSFTYASIMFYTDDNKTDKTEKNAFEVRVKDIGLFGYFIWHGVYDEGYLCDYQPISSPLKEQLTEQLTSIFNNLSDEDQQYVKERTIELCKEAKAFRDAVRTASNTSSNASLNTIPEDEDKDKYKPREKGGRRALRKRTHRKKRELRKRTLRKNRTKRRA